MQESEVYFIQDIYTEHLTIINGVSFTRREIDIISCLLSARGTSKIASLLCISPKTVVAHIRNIMLKLECNSRESIIDFIENSNKISIIRKYYLGLLIDIAFEKNLQQISKFNVKSPLLCFIVYWQDQRLKTSLVDHLAHHLKLAGIIPKVQEQELSQKIIRSQDSNHTLFLLIKKEKQQEIPLEHLKNESIDTFKNENYYDCIFEILKKIYLPEDINGIFKQFKEYYKNIQHPSGRESKAFLDKPQKKTKKKIYYYILTILFVVFFICFFNKYYKLIDINSLEGLSTNLHLEQEKKKITSYIPTILTKYETFIDRKENIVQINKLFSKNNVIVITGRPGVGKSCLAAEYAKEQDRIVRYVDADSSEKIAQKYRELGQEFGIDLINQPRNLVMFDDKLCK